MRLFDAVHAMGIHTAIETNGYLGERLSDEELEDIDLVLLDMKAFTLEQHKRVAGIANEPVIAFAERLAALRRPMWLRYVLVPGLTDVPTRWRQLGGFAPARHRRARRRSAVPPARRVQVEEARARLPARRRRDADARQVDAAIAIFASKGLKAC
jgi:pyruvate formate lyase activating enzyme